VKNVLLKGKRRITDDDFFSYPSILSPAEEKRLFQKLEKDPNNKQLKDEIILRNEGLVRSMARNMKYLYVETSLSFKDICQEGFMGLMNAVKKFNWKKGYKFSTHAAWWIKQAMTRGAYDRKDIIRIPFYLSERIFKYNKLRNILEQKLGREPSLSEIAKELGLKEKHIRQIEKIKHERIVSLDSFVGNTSEKGSTIEGTRLIEMLEKKNICYPQKEIEQDELKKEIDTILSLYLTEKEARVLKMRMGMTKDNQEQTLQQVGNVLGLTKERIRQIERQALRKLRNSKVKEILKGFL